MLQYFSQTLFIFFFQLNTAEIDATTACHFAWLVPWLVDTTRGRAQPRHGGVCSAAADATPLVRLNSEDWLGNTPFPRSSTLVQKMLDRVRRAERRGAGASDRSAREEGDGRWPCPRRRAAPAAAARKQLRRTNEKGRLPRSWSPHMFRQPRRREGMRWAVGTCGGPRRGDGHPRPPCVPRPRPRLLVHLWY
jgi:hypothetical protein